MLNDLLPLAKAMAAHGMAVTARHPGIKDMAKGGALCVMLGPDGEISALLPLDDAGRGSLLTIRDGQQNSFPGLSTDSPLLAIPDDALAAHRAHWKAAKTPEAKRVALRALAAAHSFAANAAAVWPRAGHRARIAERLALLQPLAASPETAAVPEVHARFLRALQRDPGFLHDLCTRLAADDLDEGLYDWAERAFTGKVALLVDVRVTDGLRSARSSEQIEPVSVALAAEGGAGVPADSKAEGACALTGAVGPLHTGNFPQPNLPGLGQTYVFARNRDIPAMARYGREAADSFPLAAGTAERLAGALQALVSSDHEHKTWRMIPAEAGKSRDLLIAFNPVDLEAPLAEALGGEEPAATEAAFTQMTSVPMQQAGGLGQSNRPEPSVRVLVLRQLDPANRKTIYHREISAQALGEAAHTWKSAVGNVPDWLTLPVLVDKELRAGKPPFLSPLSLTSVSRRSYTRGRLAGVEVAGIPLTTAYQIFLREGDCQNAAKLALRLLLERNTALLLGIADACGRGTNALRERDRNGTLRQDALRAVTWIGALLQVIGHRKEDYVTDTAFRLGQLLAAADTVHIGYCFDVRGGQIPPTLLGNSLLTVAGQDPIKALALLQQRWKPYAGWANRRKDVLERASKRKKDEAYYAMRSAIFQALQVQETSAALHQSLATHRIDNADAFRAELLLGYMAGFPRQNRDAADVAAASDAEEDGDA